MVQASFEKRTFLFKQPSGTSRGILTEKHAWFISVWETENPSVVGLGECSIIPSLSPDFESIESYEKQVSTVCNNIQFYAENTQELVHFPSILFGLETALLDLKNGGKGMLFESEFTQGKREIPINGLIWMGSESFMKAQVEEKLAAGFQCIKMKVGAIDFDKELDLLRYMRSQFSAEKLVLRVDANGAFTPDDALGKLEKLAEFELHSIEQPIAVGQLEAMKNLCAQTPLPIALDEELIGIHSLPEKRKLLEYIQPQYIILKPSLHGGISGSTEWIKLAEELRIPWWMTSALESNVGLNAIAQFTATFQNNLPQGLGTGSLYLENTPSQLELKNGWMRFAPL
jgi:o-succinylbenzoate synthase